MRRRRSWAARFAPAAVILFVTTAAFPRSVVFFHHHAGGDHDHVHAWGEDAFADHHDDEDHPHHHHLAHGGPGLEDAAGDHGDHVHVQAPFQQATWTQIAHPVLVTLVRPLIGLDLVPTGWIPVLATPARAPPLRPVC